MFSVVVDGCVVVPFHFHFQVSRINAEPDSDNLVEVDDIIYIYRVAVLLPTST